MKESESQKAISEDDVRNSINLSMLDITVGEEMNRMKKNVESMRRCIQQIQKVDTTNVEPLSTVHEKIPLPTRRDVANPKYEQKENDYPQVLRHAQQTQSSFFAVPKQKSESENDN
jgi:aspartyl/glutamyl-tRNA(Asn/Gln) amidotransferase C subunit